jgi:antitoxin (DNA-binding transcriptional repressor) of toxin-antitoxin stability system
MYQGPLAALSLKRWVPDDEKPNLHVPHFCGTIETMPSVNIRELRDTRRLKAWLRSGKTVELRDRQEVIARIIPAQAEVGLEHWPDFASRRQRIFGKRLLSGADVVIEERGRF